MRISNNRCGRFLLLSAVFALALLPACASRPERYHYNQSAQPSPSYDNDEEYTLSPGSMQTSEEYMLLLDPSAR